MRVWEYNRYDWSLLGAQGSAVGVPAALDDLSSAPTSESATAAYWRLDNTVVVQGSPYESAVATAACVVALLPICSAASRPRLIELLEQLTGEESAIPMSSQRVMFREVIKAYGFFIALVQHGSDVECSVCVDLLLYCATHETTLQAEAQFYLECVGGDETRPEELRRYATKRLEFAQAAWRRS